jgi:hypothetical protein
MAMVVVVAMEAALVGAVGAPAVSTAVVSFRDQLRAPQAHADQVCFCG